MSHVIAGVTKHRTGHTVRTGPKYWSFLYEKRIESTCCDMKTDILEGNANDRPNYDVT